MALHDYERLTSERSAWTRYGPPHSLHELQLAQEGVLLHVLREHWPQIKAWADEALAAKMREAAPAAITDLQERINDCVDRLRLFSEQQRAIHEAQ